MVFWQSDIILILIGIKRQSNPITGLERPWVFQDFEAPRFQDNRHRKMVRLFALGTGRLYPKEVFLVLISVIGWVDPRTTVLPEGLCEWKIPVTPLRIEPAAFRLVAQCLNQLRYGVPLILISTDEIFLNSEAKFYFGRSGIRFPVRIKHSTGKKANCWVTTCLSWFYSKSKLPKQFLSLRYWFTNT